MGATFYYHVYNNPRQGRVVSQLNPVHALTPFLKRLIIILGSMCALRFSSGLIPFRDTEWNSVIVPRLSNLCYSLCPASLTVCDLMTPIRGWKSANDENYKNILPGVGLLWICCSLFEVGHRQSESSNIPPRRPNRLLSLPFRVVCHAETARSLSLFCLRPLHLIVLDDVSAAAITYRRITQ
jgi:hypothetical protein